MIPARSGGQSTVNSRWSVEERLDFDACGSQLMGKRGSRMIREVDGGPRLLAGIGESLPIRGKDRLRFPGIRRIRLAGLANPLISIGCRR